MTKRARSPFQGGPFKLSRLPDRVVIVKRPLLHPPIASARAGSHLPKVIYVSAHTPIMSITKRAQKYLAEIDKRSMGRVDLLGAADDQERIKRVGHVGGNDGNQAGRATEEVLIKATGRAIERALQVALFFQGKEGLVVRLMTGSVGAIDDIVVAADPERSEGGDAGGNAVDVEREGDEIDEEQAEDAHIDEIPETRIRRTSMLEVRISFG